MLLWGRSVLGCQKVPPWFHQGSAKVSPRLHRGFTEVSPRLTPKGCVEGSPITSLNLSPSSSTLFCIFSPTALALGSSAILVVKVLGQMTRLSSGVLCSKMAFASQKVLWSVPQTVLYIGLTVSCGFLGKWLLL